MCDCEELINAIKDQTIAITALVQSNRELISCMAGQDDGEEQEEPQTYMDGSPA